MWSSLFALISFVACACAYQVTSPGGATGWTTVGPNTVSWQRVNSDALNFTLLLVNTNDSSVQQILAALVDGTTGTFTVRSPNPALPVGNNFRVNLVKDSQSLTTIYAQSQEFAITQSSTTTSPSSTTPPGNSPSNTPVAQNTDDLNPATSLTNTTAPTTNSADRISAAGSTSLIFAALAALIL